MLPDNARNDRFISAKFLGLVNCTVVILGKMHCSWEKRYLVTQRVVHFQYFRVLFVNHPAVKLEKKTIVGEFLGESFKDKVSQCPLLTLK